MEGPFFSPSPIHKLKCQSEVGVWEMNGFLHARIILRLITFHATLELITFLLGKLIGRDRFRQPYSWSGAYLGALYPVITCYDEVINILLTGQ